MFTVSINPSYFCNFSCDFCYLTPEQLSDQKKISLEDLDRLLNDIPSIEYVDLYGGEIGALKKDYFYGLKDTVRKHYDDEINIITNYSMLHEGFYEDDVYLSVSYDFEAREKSDLVYENMLLSPVPIAVLILASPVILEKDVEEMIMLLNMCSSVESVEIKPYSINQANSYTVTHKDFEDHIIKWLEADTTKNFQFVNEDKIQSSISKEYNAFSDNHIYITPNGKYGVLEFDESDKEYFLELATWQDYIAWTEKEKSDNVSSICKSCKYFGNCLTEHYRYVKDLDNSCNGYRGLLEYMEYKNA
jgi:MoaA/NifB/PqqE/SkfB family radical SAM enzyme|tara:strand:+ start:2676 stop:3584 length:909 start_codon:yes stop_codon:yes gene_type:complete